MKQMAIFAGAILAAGLCAQAGAGNNCRNPVAAWARTLGVQRVRQNAIAVDDAGNVLIAGYFEWPVDFDPTEGVDEHTSNGEEDIFVTKLRADGSYAWTRTIGGAGADGANGIAFDSEGNILIVGSFRDTVDFDPTDGVDQHTALDNPGTVDTDPNSFVSLLGPDGSYVWTETFGGGLGSSSARAVAVDSDGAVTVVGRFHGTVDFDSGITVDGRSSAGGSFDIYVTKINNNGSYTWTRTVGGGGTDAATDVAVDDYGDIVITGTFRGTVDFDPTEGVDQHFQRGRIQDIFVTKLYADGSYGWTWARPAAFAGGLGRLAVDAVGNVATTGGFGGTVDFDATDGTDLHTSPPDVNSAFVTKLLFDGSYAWTASFLSTFNALGKDVAFDANGEVVVTGSFQGDTDFDPTDGVDERGSVGNKDVFVTRLTTDGNHVWTRTMGEPSIEIGDMIAVGPDSAVLVAGSYSETLDLDPGCGVDEHTTFEFNSDQFILKLECVEPTADVNDDGFADLRDYATMQNCFSGPAPTVCDSACYHLDLDGDDDIDGDDHAAFVQSMMGP